MQKSIIGEKIIGRFFFEKALEFLKSAVYFLDNCKKLSKKEVFYDTTRFAKMP